MKDQLNQRIETLIDLALKEDLDEVGDLTSLHFVPDDHRSTGAIHARETCVISGLEIAAQVFMKVDDQITVEFVAENGASLAPGECAMKISGPTQSILTAERTALNFLQRLTGIASLTRQYVDLVAHTKARILDTRKTTPGWRLLEKKAVADGGGTNHRMGLYDAVMVKDNHLVAEDKSTALEEGIGEIHKKAPGTKIELEADTLEQVSRFLTIDGVDVILLDNMSNEQLREAIAMRDKIHSKISLEASGGVTLETLKSIAETGVDFISVGALTHSATAIDLGLDLESA